MYIDAYHDAKKNKVLISERTNGKRIEKTLTPTLFLYEEDKNGKYISTTGVKCKKVVFSSNTELKEYANGCKSSGISLFESNIKPLYKTLEEKYINDVLEPLHITFFDIETDFDDVKGYSPASEAFNPITCISAHNCWENILYTLVLKPNNYSITDANNIIKEFPNTILCKDEKELLLRFLDIIKDTDIISGWNSGPYDIPYIINRIIKILGEKYTRKLCLFDMLPEKKEYEKFGETQQEYNLIGRVHLDYLDLIKKFSYHSYPTYRLGYIGQEITGETKTEYEGTLSECYHNDFRLFIEYSRQDVQLLVKIDKKQDFINFVNLIAHDNLVPIPITLGTILLVDNAITLEAHKRGMVVPDRVSKGEGSQIAGAYVAEPKPGIVEWVFSVDIASEYPSTFRSLNMSPETIIGQIKHTLTKPFIEEKLRLNPNENQWSGIFEVLEVTEIWNKTDTVLTIDFDIGDSIELSAKEIWDLVINNNWILTANGTIFNNDIQGIVPSLLSRWYSERKDMQKKTKEYLELSLNENNPVKKKEYIDMSRFWDIRQLSRKVLSNSLYGGIVNDASQYFDQRMGQSCTLSGRCITRHMACKNNELLTGKYELGDIIQYIDTDSNYISISSILPELKKIGYEHNKDNFIDLADMIAEKANESFPSFMKTYFNVPEIQSVIKCAREICATSVLFVSKKKYACLYYDKDGKRYDKDCIGKLKIMGLDIIRSENIKFVQDSLEKTLKILLETNDIERLYETINKWRNELYEFNPWDLGTSKSVNNLTSYTKKYYDKEKVTIPGHVAASINWNELRKQNSDNKSIEIKDGFKVIVVKLTKDKTIALPKDQANKIPDWFLSLPFDKEKMINDIDKKIQNTFGCVDIDMKRIKLTKSNDLFKW